MNKVLSKEEEKKLIAFINWLNSDANTQVCKGINAFSIMRVINGDLAHLYDGLLAGHKLKIEGTTSFGREASHYVLTPPKTISVYGVKVEMFEEGYPRTGDDIYIIAFGYRSTDVPQFYAAYSTFYEGILKYFKLNETLIKNKADAEAIAESMNKQSLAGK